MYPRARTSPRRRRSAAVPALVAGLFVLVGCETSGTSQGRTRSTINRPGAPAGPREPMSNAPLYTDRHRGLEVQSWLAPNDPVAIARTLEPFEAEPVLADPWAVERWRRSGVRVLSVPLDQLDRIRTELDDAGSMQSRWLGETGNWTPVVEGPDLGETRVATEDGPIQLTGGRLRLIARSWVTPVLRQHAGLQQADAQQSNPNATPAAFEAGVYIEVAPQHATRVDPLRQAGFDPKLAPRPRDPLDEGLVFRRLGLSGVLPANRAILLIAESPDADWQLLSATETEPPSTEARDADPAAGGSDDLVGPDAAAEPEPDPDPEPSGIGPVWTPGPWAPLAGAPDAPEAGPTPPRLNWLGEAMLTSTPGQGSGRYRALGSRLIVVLAPRVPSSFDLLGSGAR